MHKNPACVSKREGSLWKWVGGWLIFPLENNKDASIERGAGSGFHIKVKMCDTLWGSHFLWFFLESLCGLWRHSSPGTAGESTVGQGRAIMFSGSWVSRLLSWEWVGHVAELDSLAVSGAPVNSPGKQKHVRVFLFCFFSRSLKAKVND